LAPGGLQRTILKDFKPQAVNWRQESSREPFYNIPGPKLEICARRFPERHFGAFLASGWKLALGGF